MSREHPGMRSARLFALFVVLAALPAAADVYRWVEKDGRVHFGDRPPPGSAERITVPVAPAPDAGLKHRRLKQRRLLDAFEEERQLQGQAAKEAAQEAERRRQFCRQAQHRLRGIEASRRVYELDEHGNRAYRWWDDNEKQQATAEARQAVQQYCD
jgi:hypothetical protein